MTEDDQAFSIGPVHCRDSLRMRSSAHPARVRKGAVFTFGGMICKLRSVYIVAESGICPSAL